MKSIKKYASLVDTIDLMTGPLSFALIATGSKNLSAIGAFISTTELLLLKAPFVLSYLSKTKDYNSLIYWVPKELISNYIPVNGLIDIFPAYRWRCNYFLSNETKDT
ncbi:MAG: hypothetical protein AB7V77_03605 [Candidatus Woesearchaeota archaeon]